MGPAFIAPPPLSTVNDASRGNKYRAAAFGVWGAVISGAAAVGPLAGGALTQWASWPWIFLVNLPLGVLVFIAALFTVPETRGEKKRPGIDVDGALLGAFGFGALVFAVIEGPPATGPKRPHRRMGCGGGGRYPPLCGRTSPARWAPSVSSRTNGGVTPWMHDALDRWHVGAFLRCASGLLAAGDGGRAVLIGLGL